MLNESILVPVINSLPIFLEAARASSFTQASKALGISQPSVSRHIILLEKYLGTCLFYRNQKQLKLTEDGYKLFQATSNCFNLITPIVGEIKNKHAHQQLTLGLPPSLLPWASDKVPHLSRLLGETKLRLVTIESRKLNDHNDVDLSIQFGSGNWAGYESILLINEEVFPVCATSLESHTQWLSKKVTPANLINFPRLQGYKNETGYLCWKEWFDYFGITCRQIIQCDDPCNLYTLNIESAIRGKGVILAWKGTIESYIKNEQLVELPNMRMKGNNGYYLVYRSSSWFSGVARAWLGYIT